MSVQDQVFLGTGFTFTDVAPGAVLLRGQVVIRDLSANAAVKRTTLTNDPLVNGVVVEGGPVGTRVVVASLMGQRIRVKVAVGAIINRGDRLVTDTVPGQAKVDNTAGAVGVFGFALEAKAAGTGDDVDILLLPLPSASIGGSISGLGTINEVTYFTAPTVIASDPGHRWDPVTKTLGLGIPGTYSKIRFEGARVGPAAVQNTDVLGDIQFYGYSGLVGGYLLGGGITVKACQPWSAPHNGSEMLFTTALMNNTAAVWMKITSSANLLLGTLTDVATGPGSLRMTGNLLVGTADSAVGPGTVRACYFRDKADTLLIKAAVGAGITVAEGANGDYTVGTTGLAPSNAQYLVLSADASLTQERVFVAGAGLTGTDGGAGGNWTLNIVAADGSLTVNADNMTVGLVPISKGGTGETTKAAAFDALAPTSTKGDIIYRTDTLPAGVNSALGIGSLNQVLAVSAGGLPAWTTLSGAGGVTGSGTGTQIAFFTPVGASTAITSDAGLYWDNVNKCLQLYSTTADILDFLTLTKVNATTHAPTLAFQSALVGPAAITTGKTLGVLDWRGYDGVSYEIGAEIVVRTEENWGVGANGSYMAFFTAINGNAASERARFSSLGNLLINTLLDAGYIVDIQGYTRVFTDGGSANLYIQSAEGAPTLRTVGSKGTIDTPSASFADNTIGLWATQGRGTTGWGNGGTIQCETAELWSDTAHGSRWRIFTINNTKTAGYEAVRVEHSGNVMLSLTNDTGYRLQVNQSAQILGYFNPASTMPVFSFLCSRTSVTAPSVNSAGDVLISLEASGYTDSYYNAAGIRFLADTGWGATGADSPGKIQFLTTPNSSATLAIRYDIDSAGTLTMQGDYYFLPSVTEKGYLGSSTYKFKEVNALTGTFGDLNLKHDGRDAHWTIIEEHDFVRVKNNKTGKAYKMMLEELL